MILLLPVWFIFSFVTQLICAENVEMNKEMFDSLTSSGIWFVEHFSPYCHFCIAFAPTWKELTEEETGLATTHDIHFGSIDCSVQGDLCHEHQITGFPMLNLYTDGKFVETYKGPRTKEDIKSYLLEHHSKRSSAAAEEDTTVQAPDSKSTTTATATKDSPLVKPNPNGHSVVFDAESFKLATQDRPYFVKFYAPWCPHCQHLAPIWEQMAKELTNQIDVGEVNCDDHRDVCHQNQIDGFPTLKLFANGQVYEYSGDRSLPNLITFAKKMAGPIIKTVNEAQFQQDLDPNGVAFIYLHKDESDAADSLLEGVGKQFIDGLAFYKSTDQKLVRQYELSLQDLPLAMIVKDGHYFLYPGHQFESAANMEALTKWIQLEKYPVVSQVNPVNAQELLQGERMVVLGVFGKDDQASHQQFRKLAEKGTGRDRRSRVKADRAIFAQLDMDTYHDFARQAYNIQKNNAPAIIIVDGKKKQYFNRDTKLNLLDIQQPQTILQTLDDAVAGKIKGISTLSLPARLGQHLQQGYYQARSHSYVTLAGFTFLGVLVYKVLSSKRKQQTRSSVLPTTHQD
ncbi:thioredoxin-like protein [Absidia repens]|uniref:Thioredoxin-like protein n=1 Tax=Absidia repens TaxID=90262 RepID=A0A1X2IJV2_9FUNG|nr:thioredoxin-like protein [Absidia repens]